MAILVDESKLRKLLDTFADDVSAIDHGGKPEAVLIEEFITECKKV